MHAFSRVACNRTQIVIQFRHSSGKRIWAAVVRTTRGVRAGLIHIVDVVRDDQVQLAVAVVVEERRGDGPVEIVQPGFLCDVAEGAVAIVEEEFDAAVAAHQHIGQAVVVDVADGDAGVVAGDAQAGADGDIAKVSVWLLMVKAVERTGLRAGALQKIQVQPTIIVIVKQSRAGTHRLRHKIAIRWPCIVDEIHSRLLRNILEPGNRHNGRGRRSGGTTSDKTEGQGCGGSSTSDELIQEIS